MFKPKSSCIITYQKSNGEIFIRPYDYSCFSKFKNIGDETSMGWKVLDIHYKINDNYYCYDDYMKIYKHGIGSELREKRRKKLIKFAIKQLEKIA